MKALLDFLAAETVCALAVQLGSASTHAAAMHFSFKPDPLELYFSADRTQRKFRPFDDSGSCSAAVVIGLSEEKWISCQMSGDLMPVQALNVTDVKVLHYERIPSAKQFEGDPNTVFLRFKPRWIRLTDFNSETPTVLFQSDQCPG